MIIDDDDDDDDDDDGGGGGDDYDDDDCDCDCDIPLTNLVFSVRTEFFAVHLWPKREARGP